MGDKKRKLAETPAEESVAPDVKKAKKEKKEKKEKRKADDVTEEVPHAETHPKSYEKWKQEKKEKKERKKEEKKEKARRKQEKAELDEEAKKAKKERKDRKYNKNKKPSQSTEEKAQAPQEEQANGDAQTSNDAEEGAAEEGAAAEGAAAEGKNARFICFVGNLPYSANTESVQKHFEKNPPALVRVATQKEKPTKCRGFAFIEFDNFDRMKSCLKLYHHSTFDDGKYPPRAINVELTAGGGGNTDYRKGKIEAKNKKLFEERQRNAKQIQKDKKKHDKSGQKGANAPTGANAVGMDGANDEDDKYAGVHPSRRPRMW